jgi:hypothetical protein
MKVSTLGIDLAKNVFNSTSFLLEFVKRFQSPFGQ